MNFANLIGNLYALGHVKLSQLAWRLRKRLRGDVSFPSGAVALRDLRRPINKWVNVPLYNERRLDDHRVTFLNDSRPWPDEHPWRFSGISQLWEFNLHYFDDLSSDAFLENKSFYLDLVLSWISHHKNLRNIAWHPYPTSLRLINIHKQWLADGFNNDVIVSSLLLQTRHIKNNLEKDLLCNHYLANLKALIFSGYIFNDVKLIQFSETKMVSQLREQVNEDGGHFERSPMYQGVVLADALDILNLLTAYDTANHVLGMELRRVVPKMLRYYQEICHPDGEISYFNDCAGGYAPRVERLIDYAKQLDLDIPHSHVTASTEPLIKFSDTGFIVARQGVAKMFFDCGQITPAYNPGHAHAAALSFELSIGRQRVFVNSGCSQYGSTIQREKERSGHSQNTVQVDCHDSSHIVSGFRLGRRAKVALTRAEVQNGVCHLSGQVDGFARYPVLPNKNHTREITFSREELVIKDTVKGFHKYWVSRLHLHPDITCDRDGSSLVIAAANVNLLCDLGGMPDVTLKIREAKWNKEFGAQKKNICLEFFCMAPTLTLVFKNAGSWNN